MQLCNDIWEIITMKILTESHRHNFYICFAIISSLY